MGCQFLARYPENCCFSRSKCKNLHIWSILVIFLESAHLFTYKIMDKKFNSLFSKKLSKTLYFHEKTVITSLFLVRFQIRLIHMTALFILHATKEKNIKKYFRQVYRG